LNLFSNSQWSWPAFVLAFSLGCIVALAFRHWLVRRFGSASNHKVNQDYFKGLNFVLNEEPDKAIEVFIKALEVDSETVELHLALGGLFRRKGQVDRATRIHQNLIARPSLNEEQRLSAIYELAQDYYKAGLLDRAEDLFKELKESQSYRRRAINGLCRVYSQEKEWLNAIEVLREHKRADRSEYAKPLAHFWCELAIIAIQAQEFDCAREYLRSALKEDSTSVRPVLLRGDLAYQQGLYAKAIDLWHSVIDNQASLSELVVEKMVLSYQALNDQTGLKSYLLKQASIPKSAKAFHLWQATLVNVLGEDQAIDHIFAQVHQEGLSGPVAAFLYKVADQQHFSSKYANTLLKDLLNHAKNNKIEYTCAGCGFETRALYWHCPNCSEWETFR